MSRLLGIQQDKKKQDLPKAISHWWDNDHLTPISKQNTYSLYKPPGLIYPQLSITIANGMPYDVHNAECPYWDQALLNTINSNTLEIDIAASDKCVHFEQSDINLSAKLNGQDRYTLQLMS